MRTTIAFILAALFAGTAWAARPPDKSAMQASDLRDEGSTDKPFPVGDVVSVGWGSAGHELRTYFSRPNTWNLRITDGRGNVVRAWQGPPGYVVTSPHRKFALIVIPSKTTDAYADLELVSVDGQSIWQSRGISSGVNLSVSDSGCALETRGLESGKLAFYDTRGRHVPQVQDGRLSMSPQVSWSPKGTSVLISGTGYAKCLNSAGSELYEWTYDNKVGLEDSADDSVPNRLFPLSVFENRLRATISGQVVWDDCSAALSLQPLSTKNPNTIVLSLSPKGSMLQHRIVPGRSIGKVSVEMAPGDSAFSIVAGDGSNLHVFEKRTMDEIAACSPTGELIEEVGFLDSPREFAVVSRQMAANAVSGNKANSQPRAMPGRMTLRVFRDGVQTQARYLENDTANRGAIGKRFWYNKAKRSIVLREKSGTTEIGVDRDE